MKTKRDLGERSSYQQKHITLSCLKNAPAGDEIVKEIRDDLAGKSSILEVMQDYISELKGEVNNDALPYRKLKRLFELGATPQGLDGFYFGVAIGIQTGDLRGAAAEYGNILGYLWGMIVSGSSPWVGKTFTPMNDEDRQNIVGTVVQNELPVYRGINHFNVIEHAPLSVGMNAVLTFMWHLKEAPDAERLKYGYEKEGGHFAAYRAPSVYERTPREVLSLNYRFLQLDNHLPLIYLIDELVEIADGLYLGQLLLATEKLVQKYDPAADESAYDYQHFGYFILFDESWNEKAGALFPFLGMPKALLTREPGSDSSGPPLSGSGKFTTLTLAKSSARDANPGALKSVQKDLSSAESIMHLLKFYSDKLGEDADTRAPEFSKLHALFCAGIGPKTMDGFWRGALVTFQSQGLIAAFHKNTLNIAWKAARFFTPWTGKRFDPITPSRLEELTDGKEVMDKSTVFGSNTDVFRNLRQKIVAKIMRFFGTLMEDATDEDRRRYGYDVLSYFFIGKEAASILPENQGRSVFQFNYRWKGLATRPPDNFCIDEIVQIADGLYLGQLNYATELLLPWDPKTDPSDYKYKLFGYFLLMDEEWHATRLRIGFDLDNV